MQPVSEEFNDAVRSGGSPLVTVTVGDTTLGVVDGSVTIDSTATTRAACSLTLAVSQDDLDFGGLIPDQPEDLLAPYGNEITIRRGYLVNGEAEMVQLGIFRIDEVEVSETNDGQVLLTVSGMDRSMVLIDAVFETAGQIGNQSPASASIILLAYAGYGGSLRISDPFGDFGDASAVKVPLVGWEAGDDRWDFMLGLSEAVYGSDLFFDPGGVLTMLNRADKEQPPAVWEFTEGEDATLLGVAKRWSREDAVNRVVVEGANSKGDPVYGEARDTNPNSPTFYSSEEGKFGKKTMTWSSDWIQYPGQAQAVAARILRENIGTHQEIGFDSLVHPALEPNDVVIVRRPQLGVNEEHIIESVTIPLALDGTMSVTTRRYQITDDTTPPPPLPSGTLGKAIADTASITDARSFDYKPGGVAPTLPPAGMTLKWSAAIGVVAGETIAPVSAGGDWDAILNETVGGPDPVSRSGYVEITAPPTEVAGHRNEIMSNADSRGGALKGDTYYYEWEVYIPSSVTIPQDSDGFSTINQFKGRNDLAADSHYTGGFGIRTDEKFEVRIRGGNYVGPGNIYSGMNDVVFGNLIRDHWHKIGYHVKWASDNTGFGKVYLDGNLLVNKPNVPTASEYSLGINYRVGWYPERVGPTSVVMRVRNVKVYR
jgi:hypothetical protein